VAGFLSSHLCEPCKTLFEALNQTLPVTDLGLIFNNGLKNHPNELTPLVRLDVQLLGVSSRRWFLPTLSMPFLGDRLTLAK
jgi:hypothetical protein